MKVIWSSLLFSSFLDFSIDAPPSFKPAKKYSDVSGLLVSIIISVYVSIKYKISQSCLSKLLVLPGVQAVT